MTELIIVLCVIGILMLLVLPNNNSIIMQARAVEAQTELSRLQGLQKSYFYRFGKYSNDFDAIGYEPHKSLEEGGSAFYRIEIIEASTNSFKARATAQTDVDGDGDLNTWEIDQDRILIEVLRD